MDDAVPLGREYSIDAHSAKPAFLVCDRCRAMIPINLVSVYQIVDGKSKYKGELPIEALKVLMEVEA